MAERPATPPKVYGVIPAAGKSERMGQPKQLLPFGDTTVLQTVIASALAANLDALVVVVSREIADALELEADKRFMVAVLREADAEMIDSIMLGIDRFSPRHLPTARDGFLVIPGDMPTIPWKLIAQCADTYRENPSRIVVAAHGEKLGHPIVAPLGTRGELKRLRGVGLKGLFDVFPESVLRVGTENDAALRDIDTPADYDDLTG